jgi:Lipocalin-like domain
MKCIILAVALAGVLTVPAKAQSLRDQLVGAWSLVSCNDPDFLPCAGNNGILIYDASGHYTWMMAARGRPKAPAVPGEAGANRGAYTSEQYRAMASGLFAQFGTWSVNEANKTVTLHVDAALFPNIEGTDYLTLTHNVSGDELRSTYNVWRRIKG